MDSACGKPLTFACRWGEIFYGHGSGFKISWLSTFWHDLYQIIRPLSQVIKKYHIWRQSCSYHLYLMLLNKFIFAHSRIESICATELVSTMKFFMTTAEDKEKNRREWRENMKISIELVRILQSRLYGKNWVLISFLFVSECSRFCENSSKVVHDYHNWE